MNPFLVNINLSFDNYVLLISGAAQIILGFFIVLKAKRDLANIGFFLLTTGTGIWVISNFFIDYYRDPSISLFYAKLTGAAICAFVIGLDLFSTLYGGGKLKRNNYVIATIATLFIPISLFTDLISSSVNTEIYPVSVNHGLLYYVLVIFIPISIVISNFRLYSHYRKGSGLLKLQLRYIVIGSIFYCGTTIITNLLFPLLSASAELSRIGPATTIVFSIFIGYIILRHRFFDVRLLLGRIAYFLTIAILPYLTFFGFARLYEILFGGLYNVFTFVTAIPISILFIVVFNKFNEFINNQVTLRIINPGYNALENIEESARDLSNIIDMEEIKHITLNVVRRTIRPSNSLMEVKLHEDSSDPIFLIIEQFWPKISEPLVYELLADPINNTQYSEQLLALQSEMDSVNSRVIIPFGTKGLRGYISLGSKEADIPYSITDLNFLESLAKTAGAAVERASLYTEVQNFADTLQGKVDQATASLVEANKELEQRLHEIQELRRQERDMVDVMGHELRTPMSIVRNAVIIMQGEAERAREEIDLDRLRKYLAMAVESARREVTLIETLLSATKVEGNRIQLDFIKVDFLDVVEDSFEAHKRMAQAKGIKLEFIRPTKPVYVYCDRVRVQEIMDNFLNNSIKYTIEGSVTISMRNDTAKGLTFIDVTDTGMGIAADDLAKLGKKFFRAKQYINGNKTIVRPGGTGLGLYVVFELIKLMNGEKQIVSQVGKGSTFSFGLPTYNGQEPQHLDQTFLVNQSSIEEVAEKGK